MAGSIRAVWNPVKKRECRLLFFGHHHRPSFKGGNADDGFGWMPQVVNPGGRRAMEAVLREPNYCPERFSRLMRTAASPFQSSRS